MRFKILDQRRNEWLTLPTIEKAEEHAEMLAEMYPDLKFKVEVCF